MNVVCADCGRTYDDEARWTICPHWSLEFGPGEVVTVKGGNSKHAPLVKGGQGTTDYESLKHAMSFTRFMAGLLAGLNAGGAIIATYRQEPACTAIFALAAVGAFIALLMMPEASDGPGGSANHIDEVA